MSGELNQMSDLDREILRLLAKGWHTTDHAKSSGILSDEEIAERLGAGVDAVHDRLMFLETMGYVMNEENFGADPTMTYRGIVQGETDIRHPNARYHVSEHGMRMVLSDATTDDVAPEQPR
jgi:DNA-binding Lrp family transcriptional regulator